jgi:diguanylate cyclase (GGDEF)-like protein
MSPVEVDSVPAAKPPGILVTLVLLLAPGLPLVMALAWLVLQAPSPQRVWLEQLLIPSTVLVLVAGLAWHYHRHWRRPMHRMKALLKEIRAGRMPIESLGRVGGGLAAIVPEMQEMLRELRLQKKARAELEEEMSLRVAQRTSALERMVSSLKVQATIDPLTGLYNRRWLDKQLKSVIEQCRTQDLQVCGLMIDIDHFKQLNDTLGHAQGDHLLRALAQLIRCTVRSSDAAFRFGGDEFFVLMPGSSMEAARALARRLETLVQALTKPLAVAPKPRLSIGVACLADGEHDRPEKLIELADRSLYAAKTSRSSPTPAGPVQRVAARS